MKNKEWDKWGGKNIGRAQGFVLVLVVVLDLVLAVARPAV
jgi:hypothetical protein